MKRDTKMIEIDCRFWTSRELEVRTGGNKLNACWSSGILFLKEKTSWGIKGTSCHFNRLEDIPTAIRAALAKNKVWIVESQRKGSVRGLKFCKKDKLC